jgi:uncharacterized protein (DUF2237 family)
MTTPLNVYGEELKECCKDPLTGFYRDGYCRTGRNDHGRHIACAVLTLDFLNFSKEQGNDLMTPNPLYGFPGLKAGDKWCLCCLRWIESYKAGMAPKLDLDSTDIKMLEHISLEELKKFSL